MMWRRSALAGIALAALASARGQQVRRLSAETPRLCTRIAYFSQNRSEGQLAIDYAPSEWSKEDDERFDELTKGRRWRWGAGFWTVMDTQLDLRIAGVEVPSGYYYLVLERSGKNAWYLVALDPETTRSRPLETPQAEPATGGIKVPLNWERANESRDKLTIELRPVDEHITQAILTIRWGAHKLTAPIDVSIPPGAGR